jgi:hypothetical protein
MSLKSEISKQQSLSARDKNALNLLRRKQLAEEKASQPVGSLKTVTCNYCAKQKTETDFYIDHSSNLGRMVTCKECIKALTYDEKGNFNIDKFISLLKRVDKPLIADALNKVINSGREIVGNYFRYLSLPVYKDYKYSDSEFGDFNPENRISVLLPDGKFQVTDDIVKFWGKGYDPIDYENFQNKYDLLSPSYPEKTAFHTEKLKEYIRFQCKGERALSENNMNASKQWFEEARKSADAAKINPKQMSVSDLSGGLDTFGDFFREIEKADELMDILPEFKFRPKDAVDFTIWCYINYVRDIKGLSQASYKEVYEFYDRAKEKFIAENGDFIFKNDPTEKNRAILEGWVTYDSNENSGETSEEEVM